MKLIFTLDDKDYTDDMPVLERYAVRGIICKDGKYAMQQDKEGCFKIPGGGVESGENLIQALKREVLEEVGLMILEESIKEIGEVLELREDLKKPGQKYIAHSYHYFCEVEDAVYEPKMTESELRKGFRPKWATLDEIIEVNNSLKPEKPIMRDTRFLMWLREKLQKEAGE